MTETFQPCTPKKYDAYLCMPPKGTYVVNRLLITDNLLDARRKGLIKNFYTVAEQKANTDLCQLLASSCFEQTTFQRPFVLMGTQGELTVVSGWDIGNAYYGSGDVVSARSTEYRVKNGIMDWQKITVVPNQPLKMARFIPLKKELYLQMNLGGSSKEKVYINRKVEGASHGLGDFVLADCLPDNTINNNSYTVCNGLVFRDTYSSRGWTDYIKQGHSKVTPVNLF